VGSSEYPWLFPAGIPPLGAREIHVWRVHLDQGTPRAPRLARTLSEAERTRADRLVRTRDRDRFLICRAVLRQILAGYLQTTGDRIRFEYGAQGKPYVAQPLEGGGLHFNLSHSDETALLAFTRRGPVGIDVERVRAAVPWREIAAHVFAREERELLENLPATRRQRACFVLWTGKEAYVKARGQGLSFPLDQVGLSLGPLALRRVGRDEREAGRWSLRELNVGSAQVAAVAAPGRDCDFLCWEWPWQRA
jgi:4'-phosphopantetheinyl transferase